jgi:tRNA modification GTPase
LEHGVRTAIVGRPNVGKSSLLNALLMRERAIVSDIPGTTRDTVEELMEIGGIPIHLVDTAGMRSGGDHVEQLGVERSIAAMEQADLVLAVFDLSMPWEESDSRLLGNVDPGRSIIVGNKWDLVRHGADAPVDHQVDYEAPRSGRLECEASWSPQEVDSSVVGTMSRKARHMCLVSALTGEGLDDLRELIQGVITDGEGLHFEEPLLATERQRALVAEALDGAEAAFAGATRHRDEELVCEDIRAAAQALGRITGEELTPDLLDEIFSRFCIGK